MSKPIYTYELPSRIVSYESLGGELIATVVLADGSVWRKVSDNPSYWLRLEPAQVEMPKTYSDGVVYMNCQGGTTYTKGELEFHTDRYVWVDLGNARFSLKNERMDWLKRAIAWCERGNDKEVKP